MTTLDAIASLSPTTAPTQVERAPPARPRVLISTLVHDQTATVVATALSSLGCDVQRWMMADYPQRQTLSFAVSDECSDELAVRGPDIDRDCNRFDVFWRRRYSNPTIAAASLHPADIKVVKRETQAFVMAQVAMLAPGARHINPDAAARRSDNKLLQLRLAREAGLRIPDTLISNDPARIRAFIANRPAGTVIHKHLVGHDWQEGAAAFGSYTARVALADLPEDASLQTIPGTFQTAVPKALEIRAVFFGDYCLSAAIDSNRFEAGRDDWRAIQDRSGAWQPHRLPQDIVDRIVRYMQCLGIVFGSADLILTPDGDYVFLEMNEQGQFLWLEQDCPELPILDSFCRLIVDGERFNQRPRSFAPLSLHDPTFGADAIQAIVQREARSHLICNRDGEVLQG
jgi:glutathione synthase/RimK-type ligase-like ATP-grasp enzyme